MKKIIVFLAIIGFILPKTFAQTDSSLHGELRRLLINLKRADCPAPFLYDLAAHVSNEAFYTPLSYDTSNAFNWWNIYVEMTHASYDTSLLISDTILFAEALNEDHITYSNLLRQLFYEDPLRFPINIKSVKVYDSAVFGKIPLGLMDFDFNAIDSNAFKDANKGVWYDWNDDSIWDVSGRTTEPFLINDADPTRGTCQELFAFSPLIGRVTYRNVVFTFNPSKFIFYQGQYSSNTQAHPTPHRFQLDFDDGAGWHDVDPFQAHEFTITYPSKGVYHPKARVLLNNDGPPLVIKHSISSFEVITDDLIKMPDEIIKMDGLSMGVYKGCNTTDSTMKPIIYVEGIDITENRNIPEIYDKMIEKSGELPILINHQYDIVIINWDKSKVSMKENASYLIHALHFLKGRTDSTHQFTIIGESMGGVVARYALTYMESETYKLPFIHRPELFRDRITEHNTRLFVSLDAPHQGAITPLAVQHAADWFYTVPRPLLRSAAFVYTLFKNSADIRKNALKSDAVRELLILHRDTRNSNGEYTHHSKRDDFLNSLNALNPGSGGFPQHCKTIAMSNGLLSGNHQVGYRDRIIQENDLLAELDLFLGVKIFRVIPIPLLDINDAEFRINPDGNGNVIDIDMSLNGVQFISSIIPPYGLISTVFSLRGCLTNIFKRKSSPCNTLGIIWPFKVDVNNGFPWETMPGGYEQGLRRAWDVKNRSRPRGDGAFYNNMVQYNDFLGEWRRRHAYGILFLINGTFEFELNADVRDFCFVPLQSALDYSGFDINGNPLPQDFDIENETVANNMARTPFDVIMGWRTHPDYPLTYHSRNGIGQSEANSRHLAFRQDNLMLYDINENPDFNWLTREIGEREMTLDNITIARPSLFQAEERITAGQGVCEFLIYDENVRRDRLLATASDSQNFVVDSFEFQQSFVEFKAGVEIRLMPGFQANNGSRFWAHIEPMYPCQYTLDEINDIFYSTASFIEADDKKANQQAPSDEDHLINLSNDKNSALTVFPNPSQHSFHIKSSTGLGELFLFDTQGRLLQFTELYETQTHWLELGQAYNTGIYILVLKQGKQLNTFKLIKE